MDKNQPDTVVCDDVTRESLIAISYGLPEKDLAPLLSSESVNDGIRPDAINGDCVEKYRSKLISISYSESPDVKAVPVPPGEIKG